MIDWVVYRKFNGKSLLLNTTLCLKVTKYWKLWVDDSIQQMLYISRVVIMSVSKDILFPFLRKFHIHNWNTRGIYADTFNWQGYSPLIIYLFTYYFTYLGGKLHQFSYIKDFELYKTLLNGCRICGCMDKPHKKCFKYAAKLITQLQWGIRYIQEFSFWQSSPLRILKWLGI